MRTRDNEYRMLNSEDGHIHSVYAFCFSLNSDVPLNLSNEGLKCYLMANVKALPIIFMPCGYKVEYRTIFDIPNEDTPCPCGATNHWLVRYVGKEG